MHLDGTLVFTGQMTLIGKMLLQMCTLLGANALRIAQGDSVMRHRLPVRPHRCRLCCRDGRIAQNLLGAARPIRMVSEACRGDIGSRRQDRQHSRMQNLSAPLGQGALERATREFVPEGQRALLVSNHADAEATFDHRFIEWSALFQQPQLRLSGNYADEFRDFACRRGKPYGARQYRVAHGHRHRIGHRGQNLGDEERIAAGDAVQTFRRAPCPDCELCHGGL